MKIIRSDDLTYVPAGHESLADPGVWKKVLAKRGDIQEGVVQMVNWAKLPSGKSFAAHYHEDMQELFVMVKGEARIEVAGETALLKLGDAIVIDCREVHKMWNDAEDDAEYLAIGIAAGTDGQTVAIEE